MSDYNKITDYAAKDALSSGDAAKRVKGSEIGADFDAVAVAVATKANSASPVFTGISSFAVGAVGAPSIYMTGYATTGWYNIGANNWGFAVSGAKVLDIASTGLSVTGTVNTTGNIGIGNPASASWAAQYDVLSVGNAGGSALSYDNTNGFNSLNLNTIFSGNNAPVYDQTGVAIRYIQTGSGHFFQTAISGTSGNAIPFNTIATVSSTGLTVTGTSNATATVEDIQVITNATGTNASLTNYVNTGGTVRVGVDGSTGGFSGSAYAYFVSVASGRNIQNVVNGTAVTSVSSTGLAVTGTLTATGKIGYSSAGGVGSAVTQLTSKSTSVTIDKVCGGIILHNATLNAATSVSFTVNNSTVEANDVIILSIQASISGATVYQAWVGEVTAGTFDIAIRNLSGSNLSDAVVINFAVIKAAAS